VIPFYKSIHAFSRFYNNPVSIQKFQN